MFGGLQWRQSVMRSIPIRPASVGRPQHSQLDGRTQLITLPPIVGWIAPSVWLLRLRCPPRDAGREPGNGTTTMKISPFLLHCVCQILALQPGQELPVSWHHRPPVLATGRDLRTDTRVLQSRFGECLLRQCSGDVTKVAARAMLSTAFLCWRCSSRTYADASGNASTAAK